MQTTITRFLGTVFFVAFHGSLAQAVLVTNVTQTVDGVVVSGSGTLNVSDLTLGNFVSNNGLPSLHPANGEFVVDSPTNTLTDFYSGAISTPGPFGTGLTTFGASGSGDLFGISELVGTELVVPDG